MKHLLLIVALAFSTQLIAQQHDGIWEGEVTYLDQVYPIKIEIKEAKVPNPSYPNTFSFYQITNSKGEVYMAVDEVRSKLKISIPHNIGVLPRSNDTRQLHTYRLYGAPYKTQDGQWRIKGDITAAGWTSERREGSFVLWKMAETKAFSKGGELQFEFNGGQGSFSNYMTLTVFSNQQSLLVHQEINRGFRSEVMLEGDTYKGDFDLMGALAFYRYGVFNGDVVIQGSLTDTKTQGPIYRYDSTTKGAGRLIGNYKIEWYN
jgi:hypothetical protein